MFKASLFVGLASFLAVLGSQIDAASGAPIEDVLKSLKGLSAKERLARVESEARKEGSVRWASSTPQAWAEPALQAFRKRYPMIQVEYMRQSGRVLAERIVREHRAGKYDIDIVGTSAVTFAGMKDAGVIAPYVSPEAAQLRQNMRDPTGWWVAYFGNIQAIICNKSRVKNAPNDWKDFLDHKWKGEFSIDDTRYEWFYALQKIYGDQEVNRLITGFRQTESTCEGEERFERSSWVREKNRAGWVSISTTSVTCWSRARRSTTRCRSR